MEMLNARYCRDTLVQLLRHIAIMSENQTRCIGDDRIQCEFFRLDSRWRWLLVRFFFNPSSGVTVASTLRPSAKRRR